MARNAQGTQVFVDALLLSEGGTPTFATQLLCPRSISDIQGGDRQEIEVTTLCDVAKQYELGIRDEGSVTMDIDWDITDPGQQIVQSAYEATGLANRISVRIVLPADGTDPAVNVDFEALVKKFSKSASVDDVWKAQIEFRLVTPVAYS